MFAGLRKPPVSTLELLRRTAKEVLEDDCLGMAAQLAYYFALALFPALIFLVALVSYLPWSVLDEVVSTISRVAPGEIVQLVQTQLDEIRKGNQGGLLTVGMLGAIWTSSSALVSITETLNRAYDVTESRPWWKVRLIAVGLTIGLAVFIIASMVVMMSGPAMARWIAASFGWGSVAVQAWNVLQYPLVFALASLGIAIVYHCAPDVEQDWAWITPGCMVATALWILVSLGLKIYIAQFGNYNETYGALGAAAILLLWMYLTGLAILIGGELNAEIEHARVRQTTPLCSASGATTRQGRLIVPPMSPTAAAIRMRCCSINTLRPDASPLAAQLQRHDQEIQQMRLDSPAFMTGLVAGVALGAAVAALYAPAEGPALAALRSRRAAKAREPRIDEEIDQSFPASDPPSWTPTTGIGSS